MKNETNLKQRFFNSLKRGTGEAYLIARNNPSIDFSKSIIKGALKNYAYDGQSENSRAKYIYDLILLSEKKEKIRKKILEGLLSEKEETWNLTHLFSLAKILAQEGDNKAKRTIYKRFLNNPIDYADWVGYSEILELDGLKGLLFIAEKFGKWIKKYPNDWQDDFIIQNFQDENSKIKVFEELEYAAKKNQFIRMYLDNIKRTQKQRKNHHQSNKNFNNIVDEVINSHPFLPFIRIEEFSNKEIEDIANQLLIEKDKNNQEKLLSVFTKHKYPFDNTLILNFAKEKPSSKNRIREYGIAALAFLKSDAIREFAISKILKAKQPSPYIEILNTNYKKGDASLLVEIAKRFKNKDIIENLACTYIKIYKSNQIKECKNPLEILYSKMNCGIHRNELVSILIENNSISNKIRKEIEFDSYLETRELKCKKNKKSSPKNGRSSENNNSN